MHEEELPLTIRPLFPRTSSTSNSPQSQEEENITSMLARIEHTANTHLHSCPPAVEPPFLSTGIYGRD